VRFDAYADCDSHLDAHRIALSNADPLTDRDSNTKPDAVTVVVSGGCVERKRYLCRWPAGFVQWADLSGEMVDAGRQPVAFRAVGRLAGGRDVRIDAHAHGDADADGNRNAGADGNADGVSHADSDVNSYAGASARLGERFQPV
jgi:hypothetical protein